MENNEKMNIPVIKEAAEIVKNSNPSSENSNTQNKSTIRENFFTALTTALKNELNR